MSEKETEYLGSIVSISTPYTSLGSVQVLRHSLTCIMHVVHTQCIEFQASWICPKPYNDLPGNNEQPKFQV